MSHAQPSPARQAMLATPPQRATARARRNAMLASGRGETWELLALEHRRLLSGQMFPGQQFATGYSPVAVATVDFDEDGKLDLLTADKDASNGTISWLRGNGDGTFQPKQRVDGMVEPYGVVVGDVNGDGHADVVSTNYQLVAVTLGDGKGGVVRSGAKFVSWKPAGMAAADFNGDGRTDVAVGRAGVKTLSVLIASGELSFFNEQTYALDGAPQGVAAADFNGDGKTDLVVGTDSATNGASVMFGRGDGTFAPQVGYWTGASGAPRSIRTDDFNRDGRPDLAFVTTSGQSIGVRLNRGDGTFGGLTTYSAGAIADAITAADLDGDGLIDLATANAADGTLSVLPGRGDGTFAARATYGAGQLPSDIAAGDFDGDGRADLALPNKPDNAVSVFLRRPGGTLAAGQVATPVLAGAFADFDGDGRADLASPDVFAKALVVRRGNGDGTFAAGTSIPVGNIPINPVAADFNGDGATDLATGNEYGGVVTVLLGNGNGTFAPPKDWRTNWYGPAHLVPADVNGDGRTDLVAATGNRQLVTLLGDGRGAFTVTVNTTSLRALSGITAADFNGDGRPDLATVEARDAALTVYPGNGDGTFLAPTRVEDWLSSTAVTSGDFDGDGRVDVATTNTDTNQVSAFLGNGDGTFGRLRRFTVGQGAAALVAADFDDDGRLDLATSNTPGTVSLLLGNGDGTFVTRNFAAAYRPGPNPTAARAADLNGDGKPDLATLTTVLLNDADFRPRALAATFSATSNAVTLAFSEDVGTSLAPTDLVITPAAGAGPSRSPTSVSFDRATRTARFVFASPLPDGDYRATIRAADVTDAGDKPLPGDFTADFFTLAGDANRDRTVNFADLLALAKNYGKPGTWSQGDFTGDGNVDFADLLTLAKAYNNSLPAAPPAPAAIAAAPMPASVLRDETAPRTVFSTTPLAKPAAAKPKPAAPPRRK